MIPYILVRGEGGAAYPPRRGHDDSNQHTKKYNTARNTHIILFEIITVLFWHPKLRCYKSCKS